ncbi:MAG: OPT/YSL family transporter [Candidatus Magasanikbacteria bacterium]|nr:OPT/YSL family transporter [Candidatus Magasanikbacteria bacterium]
MTRKLTAGWSQADVSSNLALEEEERMSLKKLFELSQEETKKLSPEQKDRKWLAEAYSGDAPQLTLRAIVTGMILGGLLSLSNIYAGYKTGWGLGVGITSLIMSFAMFRLLAALRITSSVTMLENNAVQSIATSAGYVILPLFSSIAAYSMMTHIMPSMGSVIIWLSLTSLLGVCIAFMLKRRYINVEQHEFPEGRAAGIVMWDLHEGRAGLQVQALFASIVITAVLVLFKDKNLGEWLGATGEIVPELVDKYIYEWLGLAPVIGGIALEALSIGVETDFPLIATGGLMSMKTCVSLLLGAIVNYAFIAPWLIHEKIITDTGFPAIASWSVWFGAALMTSAALTAFFLGGNILGAFKFGQKKGTDVLKDIEFPSWLSWIGIPVVGTIAAWYTYYAFGVPWWAGALSIPLIVILSVIGIHATALTSITPVGALAKIPQLAFSVVSPGQAVTNLMAAAITAEAVNNASSLVTDIKPGYMLGAKPRQQAWAHVLGIFAGALVAVPIWYTMTDGTFTEFGTDKFPMPSAKVWKSIAELLANGFSALHPTAVYALVIGLGLGVMVEVLQKATKGRVPFSAMGFGLAFVMPFTNSLSMFLGCFTFWCIAKIAKKGGRLDRIVVKNQETIAGGGVAGGGIMSVAIILIKKLAGI